MKIKHLLTVSTLISASTILIGSIVFFSTVMVEEKTSAAACTVDSRLVNSCRPWIGAAADAYPGITQYDFKAQLLGHESRLGRQVDLPHHYISPGAVLSSSHKFFINRADTYLMLNWKPVKGGGASNTWKDADGRNATVNTNIDNLAVSIKSVAPKKLFLTVFHEPENDVSPGGSPGCGNSINYVGNMGTTAEYAKMWENVRSRFDAIGVTNVVWVFNPMGYDRYNCMVDELWPGNDRVDWIVYDQYIYDSKEIANTGIGQFYDFLTVKSTPTHNYLSKPWGLNEWGASNASQSVTYAAYGKLQAAVMNNQYPKLKMFNIWDNITDANWQVKYTAAGVIDQAEQDAYNNFANAVFGLATSIQEPSPATDPPATTAPGSSSPTPISSPADSSPNVTASNGEPIASVQSPGTSIPRGTKATLDPRLVSDPSLISSVLKVEFYDDEKLILTVENDPFVLDTTLLSPGEHTIRQKIYFKDGTTSEKTQLLQIEGNEDNPSAVASRTGVSSTRTVPIVILAGVVMTIVSGIGAYVAHRKDYSLLQLAHGHHGTVNTGGGVMSQPSQVISPTDHSSNIKN